MNDYALVLNAGSSSLKFSAFHRAEDEDWHLESRGQIEGIGTSPRITARDSAGGTLVDRGLDGDVQDGSGALNALALWLRSMYGRAQVVGVGHRVVHGGSRFTGPVVVSQDIVAELRRLVPLAPLHQPHNVAAIEAVFERMPGVPQVACFDTSSIAVDPPSPNWFRCRARSAAEACNGTDFTGCPTNTSQRPCQGLHPKLQLAVSLSLISAAVPPCARSMAGEASRAPWDSLRSMVCPWARGPGRSIPACSCT